MIPFKDFSGIISWNMLEKESPTNEVASYDDSLVPVLTTPLIVCIYEQLRSSGVITLPSQRTLRDYTYHIRPDVGFQPEVDEMLLAEFKPEEREEWQKHVVVLLDEMHIYYYAWLCPFVCLFVRACVRAYV